MAWPTLKALLDEPEEVTIDEYFGRLKNNLNFTSKQMKADPFQKPAKRCVKSFEERIMINLSPTGTASLKFSQEDDPED